MTTETKAAAGGASFPPRYSGPSWNVPRVSLPGLFGIQSQYNQEWWYYVGTVYDTAGKAFSLQIEILRAAATEAFQIGYGITGIGWREDKESYYISGQGFGLGAGESPRTLPSLLVPPVSDHAYSASFVPWLEIVDRSPNLFDDIHVNLPSLEGSDGWKFEYVADKSSGHPVGCLGSVYSISARGRGYRTSAGSEGTTKSDYRISLAVEDKRGTVMEGISGYVGSEMFSHGNSDAPVSYECAQPDLQIQSGGTLVIDGETHTIARGSLWLDRQIVAAGESPSSQALPIPTNAEELEAYIVQKVPSPKSLYLGDWMGFVLNDGRAIVLSEFWQKSTPQWITGTKTGKPPENGFGNLYYKIDGDAPMTNGGMGLRLRTALSGDEWDYDVNILNPDDPESSPHWKSPTSGKTYATAWQIDFSPGCSSAHELPESLYVFAVSDNCEIILVTNESAFFEGAALVYTDKEREQLFGHVFVEQMGFN